MYHVSEMVVMFSSPLLVSKGKTGGICGKKSFKKKKKKKGIFFFLPQKLYFCENETRRK